jgi:uncharacterized protein (DUF427 family)
MADYPAPLVTKGHTEPCPRRVRAVLEGVTVLDTTAAVYVWEWPAYPQFYVPEGDVREDLRATGRSTPRLPGLLRFRWDAFDAWYEEDEQVFVHPRNPYARVDALRSSRHVRVELDGVLLAESHSPVLVFETGLPTRYYLDRTDVRWEHLVPTATRTACPYKGQTSGYWSVRVGDQLHADLAWAYDFPTRELLPIAGLVAFYNEKVDLILDGVRLERPVTHFSRT